MTDGMIETPLTDVVRRILEEETAVDVEVTIHQEEALPQIVVTVRAAVMTTDVRTTGGADLIETRNGDDPQESTIAIEFVTLP